MGFIILTEYPNREVVVNIDAVRYFHIAEVDGEEMTRIVFMTGHEMIVRENMHMIKSHVSAFHVSQKRNRAWNSMEGMQ